MAFEPKKECVVVSKEKKVSVVSFEVETGLYDDEVAVSSVLSAKGEMESFSLEKEDGAVVIECKVRLDCLYTSQEGQIRSFSQSIERKENVKISQNQSEYYAQYKIGQVKYENGSLICAVDFDLYENEQVKVDYLSPTSSGIFVKDAHQQYYSVELKGSTSTNLSCEEEGITGEISYLNAKIVVKDVSARDGYFSVNGEILCDVISEGDETALKTVKIPFVEDCVCECKSEDIVEVFCKVTKTDSEREGNSEGEKLVISIDVDFDYSVFRLNEFSYVADAFCLEANLLPSICSSNICVDKKRAFINDRVDVVYELSNNEMVDEIVGACDFVATIAQSKIENGKLYVDGLIEGRVLCMSENGMFSVLVSTPFASTVKTCLDCECKEVSVSVCEVSTRLKRGNEISVSCEMVYCVKCEKNESVAIINEFSLGDEIENQDGILSIIIGREGETLFDVARSACCDPALVSSTNPEIKFPLLGGERIIVFKDKTL